ncbi:MAG: polyprenyl synthetase family protein [Planctomycetaceae bacterium]|nr:polyprenyl synthetase family protein [Planctomycetaceae bacterium]
MLFESLRAELDQVHDLLGSLVRTEDPQLRPFLQTLSERRGKLLRPALVLLCGKAVSSITQVHIHLAATVELVHTASLLHDDVIDQAAIRRHQFTANAQWGNTVAVLMGDYVLSKAFSLMTECTPREAAILLCRTAETLCTGELKQNLLKGNLALAEQDYLDIIQAKTAALFETSCRLGALASNADPSQAEALGAYGRNLGMSFQIMDDLRDLVGDPECAGKTLGTDLLQEKLTMAVIHWLNSNPAEKDQRRQMLTNLSGETLVGILQDSGSVHYARAQAEAYGSAAIEALSVFPCSPMACELAALAEQIVRSC